MIEEERNDGKDTGKNQQHEGGDHPITDENLLLENTSCEEKLFKGAPIKCGIILEVQFVDKVL